MGDSGTSTRYFHPSYYTTDTYTCGGWTSATPAGKPDGSNVGRATLLTPQGGFKSSFVSLTDGGCSTPHPLTCCDGYPPE